MRDRSNWLANLFRNPLSGLEPSWRRALLNPVVSLLIALLVAQLVAALFLAGNAMQSASTDDPLLDLSSEEVRRIKIITDDEQVALARTTDGWVLPALAGFPAKADKVDQLLSRLTALQRPLPVGSSSEAQRRLKVADDNAERRIRLYGDAGELAQLLTGESPGFRRLYARLADEEVIYDLPLADFQVTSDSDEWVKHDQLRLDAEAIMRISSDDWTLSRIDGSWRLKTESSPSVGHSTLALAPESNRAEQAQTEQDRSELGSAERGVTELDETTAEALVSRIANLSYQGVRMPPTHPQQGATPGARRAGANTDSAVSSADADAGNNDGADAHLTAGPEPAATEVLSEPLLQLGIDLKDGKRRVRTVFRKDDGGYLLQTEAGPQIYELSDYDLDGLLDFGVEQLMVDGADEPESESISAPTGPAADAPAPALPEPPSGLTSKNNEGAESPAEVATTPAARAKDGEQPTSADATPIREAPSEPAATEAPSDAPTEPPVEQPQFRSQQPPAQQPAPSQWPYQRYAPPSRQPWPPQGPPQGVLPHPAPRWR